MNRCDACKFFLQMEPGGGQCRFDPPRTQSTFVQNQDGPPQVFAMPFFPTMPIDGWCGEWEQGIAIANQMPPSRIVS